MTKILQNEVMDEHGKLRLLIVQSRALFVKHFLELSWVHAHVSLISAMFLNDFLRSSTRLSDVLTD